jgi:serine/threonine protein kinase
LQIAGRRSEYASGVVDVETLYRLAIGVAQGMAHIHAVGLTHNDLKPGNVLVARGEGSTTLTAKVRGTLGAGDRYLLPISIRWHPYPDPFPLCACCTQVFDFGGAEAVKPEHSAHSRPHADHLVVTTVSGKASVEAYPDRWPGQNVVYLGDR